MQIQAQAQHEHAHLGKRPLKLETFKASTSSKELSYVGTRPLLFVVPPKSPKRPNKTHSLMRFSPNGHPHPLTFYHRKLIPSKRIGSKNVAWPSGAPGAEATKATAAAAPARSSGFGCEAHGFVELCRDALIRCFFLGGASSQVLRLPKHRFSGCRFGGLGSSIESPSGRVITRFGLGKTRGTRTTNRWRRGGRGCDFCFKTHPKRGALV